MRFQSYFNTAVQLIRDYNGSIPLAYYLKQHFAQHKKHGSKDRKYISHLCYRYYRLGHAFKDIAIDDKLKAALFLCTDNIEEWRALFDEIWITHHTASLPKRISFIQSMYSFNIAQIFPWHNTLSDGIDIGAFALSHLVQPCLFLRLRPGKKDVVVQKLQHHNISYTEITESCIALPNATRINDVVELNKEAVVQDYSSQQIQQFFSFIHTNPQVPVTIWDCCAASGGKSILAYDSFKNIDLTVSDIRPSIIHNLKQRFTEAGIKRYKSFVADLTNLQSTIANLQYSLIICDAPCTGSGTWGRTPEQLYFFTEEKLNHYSELQQKIVRAIIPYLQKDGYLLYITCSVFKKENEEIVDLIQRQYNLTLIKKELITGYSIQADTMFAALFKN